MRYTVEPVEGERSDGGFQYGWLIRQDGRAVLHATTGGTGPCWNIEEAEYTCVGAGGEMKPSIDAHVCELDDFIAALEALRDSDANVQNIARWT